ncbi:MAG: hypothetical protein AAFZ52_07090, partial [Bacteroidota bacterium]
ALAVAGEMYRGAVTNPRFGHPYYWAGLVAYGPDEGVEFVGKAGFPWWWLLVLVLPLMVLLWQRRSSAR